MAHGNAIKCVAIGLLACGAVTGHAASADGTWQGVVRDGSNAVRATLQRKGDTARVHFGEPRNCAVTAGLLEEEGVSAHFRFGPSFNGGAFCDALYPGDLVLTPGEMGTSMRFQRAGASWSGNLTSIHQP
ncbi:hypothetical protein [Luteibacter aegosomatissinici]|uniref:hypothetical protein n=1 Tax=Luteibacter aegosomatissinici TaxID=2911539 RepID=UPI001FF7FE62|nr:hypothetical protein [Luteibacter aegosomatissinici]UPG94995.1 hypothetical protein L2Y97_02495 [Luteibacter aegosomatissinici]